MTSVPVYAVCKEVEQPDSDELGIAEFAEKYFCGPLFLDTDRAFYDLLGNKPIFGLRTLGGALLNPLKARREMKEMGERMDAKGIEGNMKGDGLAKGGILVISPTDEVLHTFYEDPGKGVPPDECAAIIAAAQQSAKLAVP
mmetsp:Transcript_24998/g.42740  ORF Transcript_24998/g.42740 Transcript_24998/m.42740 type:complete len:141 (-) Transcript_24998:308-730(-)